MVSPARDETPQWQRRLKGKLNENPARFLDHDLVEHGSAHTDHTLQRLVTARIRGIGTIEVVNAWIAVERKIDYGPREGVISLLEERKAFLEEHGEFEPPNRPPEQLREWASERAETARRRNNDCEEDVEKPLSASEKIHRLRSDGGDSQ
ncbi:hypothetical protein A4G99_13840 [Haladaptatus sp. R4]|uniref:hypothetical protein n=1 Tax=Haladaptatus sp. R4 TaxID=1679489 RepID=UPI0007B49A8A|nr:hypothetical protein [Haladaptatus sp. R4]KZN23907.1 hypothetical protein A4G99_13840 [Haladaptatus sp. R4]